MKTFVAFCAALLGLCAWSGRATAEVDSTGTLIKALVNKGIITQQDADAVRDEIARLKKEEETKRTSFTVTGKRPIKLTGYIQERYIQSAQPGVPDFLEARRVRLTVAGDATENLEFKTQWELAGARTVIAGVNFATSTVTTARTSRMIMLDGYLRYKLPHQNRFTLGQFFIPFSMESLTPNTALDLINRPLVVEFLVPGRDTADQGRDTGVQYSGTTYIGGQTTQPLDYFAGLFNGAGTNAPDNNTDKDPAFRLTYKSVPIGLHLGGSYYNGSVGAQRAKRSRKGLEAALDRGAWVFKTEYIWANDTARNSAGWYATLLHRFNWRFEGVVRVDRFDPDEAVAGDSVTTTTAGLNWNWTKGGYTRIQFNYEYVAEQIAQVANNRAMAQFQAGF